MAVRRRTQRGLWTAAALTLLWAGLGRVAPSVLPGPVAVAVSLPVLFEPGAGGNLPGHLARTLGRVLVATGVGLTTAVILGLAMARRRHLDRTVSVWLPFLMTVPTLVVVFVAMVAFGFSELSVLLGVVFVTTPYATVTVREGTRTVDEDLLSMAAAYGAGRRAVLRDIYLPAVVPAVLGSARYLLSMVWKVVVLAETFGMSTGMGALFRFWFGQGDLETLLAALSVFVLVMVVLQSLLTRVQERLLAWQA